MIANTILSMFTKIFIVFAPKIQFNQTLINENNISPIGVNMVEPKIPNPKFANEVINAGGKTLNLCFQCGTCTGSCPSGRQTAFRVRKVIRMAQLGLKEDVLNSEDMWMCTTCYTCYERCPRGVQIVDIIMVLRNMGVKAGNMADAHKRVAGFLIKTGHMVPLTDDFKKLRVKFGLDEKPKTTLTDEKALGDVKKLCEITKFDKLIGVK